MCVTDCFFLLFWVSLFAVLIFFNCQQIQLIFLTSLYSKACHVLDNGDLFNISWKLFKKKPQKTGLAQGEKLLGNMFLKT